MGFTSYVGDLSEGSAASYFNNWMPIAIGELSYTPMKYFALSAQIFYGKIYGSDNLSNKRWMIERNLSFQSVIYGASLKLDAQLTDVSREYNAPITVYMTGGAEYLHFNPSTFFRGEKYFLRELGTGGQNIPSYKKDKYNLSTFVIQGGGGLKIRIITDLVMKLELVYHKTFTDYLDDVGKDPYFSYAQLKKYGGEMSALLSDRSWEYFDIPPDDYTRGKMRSSGSADDGFISGIISIQYTLSTDRTFSYSL